MFVFILNVVSERLPLSYVHNKHFQIWACYIHHGRPCLFGLAMSMNDCIEVDIFFFIFGASMLSNMVRLIWPVLRFAVI